MDDLTKITQLLQQHDYQRARSVMMRVLDGHADCLGKDYVALKTILWGRLYDFRTSPRDVARFRAMVAEREIRIDEETMAGFEREHALHYLSGSGETGYFFDDEGIPQLFQRMNSQLRRALVQTTIVFPE